MYKKEDYRAYISGEDWDILFATPERYKIWKGRPLVDITYLLDDIECGWDMFKMLHPGYDPDVLKIQLNNWSQWWLDTSTLEDDHYLIDHEGNLW